MKFNIGDTVVVCDNTEENLYPYIKEGDVGVVEGYDKHGDVLVELDEGNVRGVFSSVTVAEHRLTHKTERMENKMEASNKRTAEEIAPKLWNAYKDVLNEEALEALRDVILNPPVSVVDNIAIKEAFIWAGTSQGYAFWDDVCNGRYNKETNSHSEHLYADSRLQESVKQLKNIKDTWPATTRKPVRSDGGSSEYYKIPVKLPQPLYDVAGNQVTDVTFEAQDLLYAMFYGEWSCSNVGKAARRIAEALNGRGKEGTSIAYDAKKIIWFGEDILKRFG